MRAVSHGKISLKTETSMVKMRTLQVIEKVRPMLTMYCYFRPVATALF
jgi:hypothetical protein